MNVSSFFISDNGRQIVVFSQSRELPNWLEASRKSSAIPAARLSNLEHTVFEIRFRVKRRSHCLKLHDQWKWVENNDDRIVKKWKKSKKVCLKMESLKDHIYSKII